MSAVDFKEIQNILNKKTSQGSWDSLFESLQAMVSVNDELPEEVLAYCRERLASWPAGSPTFAPKRWFARSPEALKADPLSALVSFATLRRGAGLREEALKQLSARRASKPPAFIKLDALGALRWRDGVALEEKAQKQLLAWLKANNNALDDQDLHQLRQLLNDEDCARWAEGIYQAWSSNDDTPKHKWALFQLAYLGHPALVELSIEDSSARGSWRREIIASFDSTESLNLLTEIALHAPLHYKSRDHAASLLKAAAKRRKVKLPRLLDEQINSYQREEREDQLISTKKGRLSKYDVDGFIGSLEAAMISQRPYGLEHLQATLLSSTKLRNRMASVIWRHVEGEITRLLRWTPKGAVGVDNAALEVAGGVCYVAHPLDLEAETLEAWREHLKAAELKPAFEQLERQVFRAGEVAMPASGQLIKDNPLFFLDAGWSVDPSSEHGAGYGDGARFLPKGQQWFVKVSFSYSFHVRDLDVSDFGGGEPHQITGYGVGYRLTQPKHLERYIHSESHRLLARLLEHIE